MQQDEAEKGKQQTATRDIPQPSNSGASDTACSSPPLEEFLPKTPLDNLLLSDSNVAQTPLGTPEKDQPNGVVVAAEEITEKPQEDIAGVAATVSRTTLNESHSSDEEM